MSAILTIARRELMTYVNTMWGWVVLAGVLILDGLFFNALALTAKPQYSADVLETFFFWSSGTKIIAGLLLTMRLIAEERQSGTLVLLETAPVSEAAVVAGKFFGAMSFLVLITALTLYMPALVMVNGKVSWGQIGAGYLGEVLIGGSAVAIGTFASSISRNQLLAAVLGGLFTGFFVLAWWLAKVTSPPISDVLAYAALWDRHYQPFMRGRINTEDIVFHLSMMFVFLLAATRAMTARRWT
jgi:ABC-2 type transport system permease protein